MSILNYEVCKRCFMQRVHKHKRISNIGGYVKEFNRIWREQKLCTCVVDGYNQEGMFNCISLRRLPKNCPYITEHTVCAK
jgi:hypothetical protein